jgi:hypothetical protein
MVLNNNADDLDQGHSVRGADQFERGSIVPDPQYVAAAASSPIGV